MIQLQLKGLAEFICYTQYYGRRCTCLTVNNDFESDTCTLSWESVHPMKVPCTPSSSTIVSILVWNNGSVRETFTSRELYSSKAGGDPWTKTPAHNTLFPRKWCDYRCYVEAMMRGGYVAGNFSSPTSWLEAAGVARRKKSTKNLTTSKQHTPLSVSRLRDSASLHQIIPSTMDVSLPLFEDCA